jgi:voltage-gated sodium channel
MGEGTSVIKYWRTLVAQFLANKPISNFIYFMVLVLCVVIFTELSLGSDNQLQDDIFKYINLALLIFFSAEILLRIFAEGFKFFQEIVNVFDSVIVYVSLGLNISGINAKAVGILRVLRLIKVII